MWVRAEQHVLVSKPHAGDIHAEIQHAGGSVACTHADGTQGEGSHAHMVTARREQCGMHMVTARKEKCRMHTW